MYLHATLGPSTRAGRRRGSRSTDHAAGRLQRLGLAVQLVPEALDVVHAICDHDVVARQHSLDGRIFLRARVLLGLGRVIDIARYTKRLIVDEVHFEAMDTRIGGGAGDLGLEVFL